MFLCYESGVIRGVVNASVARGKTNIEDSGVAKDAGVYWLMGLSGRAVPSAITVPDASGGGSLPFLELFIRRVGIDFGAEP